MLSPPVPILRSSQINIQDLVHAPSLPLLPIPTPEKLTHDQPNNRVPHPTYHSFPTRPGPPLPTRAVPAALGEIRERVNLEQPSVAVRVEQPVETEDLERVGQGLEMRGLGAGGGEEELGGGVGDLRPGKGFP